jgi:hypothetical protein
MASGIDNGDGDDVIVFHRANSPNANGVPALIAQLFFMKRKLIPFLVMSTISLLPLVSFASIKRSPSSIWMAMMPPAAHVRVIRQIRFLDDARLRREHYVQVFVPCLIDGVRSRARLFGLDANRRRDFFVGLKLKDVRDRTPFAARPISGIS